MSTDTKFCLCSKKKKRFTGDKGRFVMVACLALMLHTLRGRIAKFLIFGWKKYLSAQEFFVLITQ